MSYKRQRSHSAAEEANVTSFVESCVQFQPNVSFHPVSEGTHGAGARASTVLLLGREDALKDVAAVEAAFPLPYKTVQTAIAQAPVGAAYVALIDGATRVLVGKTSTEASRHNSPARPDSIHTIVKAALAECPAQDTSAGLDIFYVGSGPELCVANAIARAANRSFSAKKGKAEQGYVEAGRPVRVFLAAKSHKALDVDARCVQLCQRLVDAPTNLLDTTTFTEIVSEIILHLKREGKDVGVDVVQGEALREQGYGGLYGTGKAAEYPPHLVTVFYKPKEGIAPRDKIAFVGKGIVYDSGGLSIKPGAGMCTMKHDMGGAAAVFTGFLALVLLDAPIEVSSTLCIAENAVGPRAQRNDDIIRMKSGITVEINNTDAEGRLVLSDGVYHASAELPYTPSIIVDMATLTGAQGMATGQHHAAIYANTEGSERLFVNAGRASGDLCFPVLYCPELHNGEYQSAVADYRNSVTNRMNAQVSCAGQFIGNNLAKDFKGDWVHVDLAYPACRDQATGFGVSLILEAFAPENFQ